MVDREFNRHVVLILAGIYLYIVYSTTLPLPWFYPAMGLAAWFTYDLGVFARKSAERQRTRA